MCVTLNLEQLELTHFMEDVWKVLVIKVKGSIRSILKHVVDTEKNPMLRTPLAWWELEKEAEGDARARKRDLARQVTHPTRARGWADIPEAIRTYEQRVNEFELLTGNMMDPDLRMQGLMDTIPQSLEKQMQAQAGIARTYSGFKEYVLEQTCHHRPSATAPRNMTNALPGIKEVEAAGLLSHSGWFDEEQRWHDGHDEPWTYDEDMLPEPEPAEHDTIGVKGGKSKGKDHGGKGSVKGKGKPGGVFPGVCWHCNMPGYRKFECYLYIGGKKGKSGGSKGGKLGKGYGKFGLSPSMTSERHRWNGKGGYEWDWPTYGLNNQDEAATGDWSGKGSDSWAEPETYTSLFSLHNGGRFCHDNPWAVFAEEAEDATLAEHEAESKREHEHCCGPHPRLLGDWMKMPRTRTRRQRPRRTTVHEDEQRQLMTPAPAMMIDIVRSPEAQSVQHDPNDVEWHKVDTFMDSGAARSVCPLTFCDEVPLTPSDGSRAGEQFRTASGTRLLNRGDRVIKGQGPQGELLAMRYAVADVAMALDSVSQICDTGAQVLFTKWGGHILGPAGKVDFTRVGDTYVRSTWVKRPRKKAPPQAGSQPTTGDDDVQMTTTETTKDLKSVTTRPFGRLGMKHP